MLNQVNRSPDDGAVLVDGSLIDFHQLADYGGFIARAVRRHRAAAALLFFVTLGTAVAAVAVWPRTYHSEATLLAHRNDLMTSLSNPSRAPRPEADDPIRAASETIHDRDNLLMIMRQTDLLNERQRHRQLLSRLKAKLTAFMHKPTDEEELNAVLWMLDQRLLVSVEKEGVLKISVDWPEPQMAKALVQAAVQNFIDRRHDTETAAIGEAISILQGSAASLQSDVDGTIAQLREEQGRRVPVARPRPEPARAPIARNVPAVAPPAAAPPGPDPATIAQLATLKNELDAKRQEILQIERTHRQQLDDLQGKLATALTIYTSDHPSVSALRQSIVSASREPSELAPLRSEAQLLEKQQAALEATVSANAVSANAVSSGAAALAAVMQLHGPIRATPRISTEDPARPSVTILPPDIQQLTDLVHPASRLLTLQLTQLTNLLDRINAARLELATSGAGLKFRYVVTRPAEVPRAAIKPNVPLVLAAALFASLLLGVAAAVGIDVAGGRVIEGWQIERQAGVPLLGIVNAGEV